MTVPSFTLHNPGSAARRGTLHLAHGDVETPVFMPVGTQASVKAVRNDDLRGFGYDLILCNTYHLYLRPGADVIEGAGGLHGFMSWDSCILTDSGGFQLWSLSGLRRRSEEGYSFQSHIDGSSHTLTPEKVVELQTAFGSDVMMVLDECLELPSGRDRTEDSVDLTIRWAERARNVKPSGSQAMFGIVQGGGFPDLREHCARELSSMDFDGYAIGGVSVGEPRPQMETAVLACTGVLPEGRPRYLMGVGRPEDLVDFAGMGIDVFDCVVPTRNARGGSFFVPGGHLNIRNARFRDDHRPVQEDCGCYVCRNHGRSYLRHLFLAREWLAPVFATLHNLSYFSRLMNTVRRKIGEGCFDGWRREWHEERERFDPGTC
jgi:queuine tRNA-ribosyltransferase